MITSFGGDGSDSEDENNSSDEKKATTPLSESENSNTVSYPKSGEIGPAICPTRMQMPIKNFSCYKSDSINISNSSQTQSEQSDERKITESDSKSSIVPDKEFLKPDKSRKDINIHNAIPKLDINVSLVPGYGDDSDGEEEVRPKQEIKPLFPIAQDEEHINVISSLKNTHSAFMKNSSNIQASDQCNDNEDTQETKNDQDKAEEKESKMEEEKSKTNIFLEDMQMCGKAFQRKRRIAFDGILLTIFYNFISSK